MYCKIIHSLPLFYSSVSNFVKNHRRTINHCRKSLKILRNSRKSKNVTNIWKVDKTDLIFYWKAAKPSAGQNFAVAYRIYYCHSNYKTVLSRTRTLHFAKIQCVSKSSCAENATTFGNLAFFNSLRATTFGNPLYKNFKKK